VTERGQPVAADGQSRGSIARLVAAFRGCIASRGRIACVGIALLVVGWLGSASIVARVLTHRRHARAAEVVPADLADRIRCARLFTIDGEDIGAWFVAGDAAKPIVILLHGMGGDRTTLLPKLRVLADRGYGVAALSLRTCGDSSGERNDIGLSARHDVVAAVEFIERECPGRRIVIDGGSMGAAAAMFAARELGDRVAGYILECPFRDLRTAVRNRLELFLPPVLDRVAWAGLLAVAPIFAPELDDVRPVDAVAAIPRTTPVLILASLADDHARPDEARAIQARIADHSELVFHASAAHDRLFSADSSWWGTAVFGFLGRLEAPLRPR
jgi:uncharacterized protein